MKMDLDLDDDSFINNVDDSFLLIKSDAMDDEVSNILKKWNTTAQKANGKSNEEHQNNSYINSRTFTRPKKALTKLSPDDRVPMEAKINSINLQVGGAISSHSVLMKKSWLGDVSPPNSMDTFSHESIMQSLITSSDFSNISGFLLADEQQNDVDKTITPRNVPVRNATFRLSTGNRSSQNATFNVDCETPLKEFGVENNVDIELNQSTEDLGKDLTFNMLTLKDVNSMNSTIVQSTPIGDRDHRMNQTIDLTPINSHTNGVDDEEDEDEVVPLRNFAARRLREAETKRESLEDQYEFLLNEETIKLSARVCGSNEHEQTLTVNNADEQEFDKMLDTFCVEIPQSVAKAQKTSQLLMKDLHERYPLKGSDRRKYEIDIEQDQQTTVNHISNDRLLSRGRVYDEFMAQQMQQEQAALAEAEPVKPSNDPDRFKTMKLNRKPHNGMIECTVEPTTSYSSTSSNSASSESILAHQPRREVNNLHHQPNNNNNSNNHHHTEQYAFKKPVPSKLSKFGFAKPTDISRNDWKYSHKASSIDNLDNRNQKSSLSNIGSSSSSNVSALGVKSKSINNLMNSNNFGYAGSRTDLKNTRNYSKLQYQPNGNSSSQANNIDQSHQSIGNSRSNMVVPSSGFYRGADSNRRAESVASDYHGSNENVMSRISNNKYPSSNNNSEGVTKLKQPGNASRLPTGLRAPSTRTSVISALPRPSFTKR